MGIRLGRSASGLALATCIAAAVFGADKSLVATTETRVGVDCAQTQTSESLLSAATASSSQTAIESGAAKQPLRHGVFRWISYPAAWTAAQKSNRPILVYVTSAQCPFCVRMVSETYQQPRIRDVVLGGFETVYVDRQSQPELVAALGVKLFPTTVLVAPSNKVLDVVPGYVAAETFGRRLQTTLAASSATSKR